MTIRIGDSILSTSAPIFSDISNRDLSNLTEVGEKHFLNKSQITNCLLEVPQNIKLELNDGTLTLKAGSKVIVPNGVKIFDEVVITNDIVLHTGTYTGTGYYMVCATINNAMGARGLITDFYSGSSAPSSVSSLNSWWYDTANNIIKVSTDTGVTWKTPTSKISLPVCVYLREEGNATSIDQIFNGMGYIGSTVWVDKGVKGLIPNGRNEDGSLNNIEVVTKNVTTHTNTANSPQPNSFIINSAGSVLQRTYLGEFATAPTPKGYWGLYYNTTEQIFYYSSGGWVKHYGCIAGIISSSSTGITSFNPKLPFRAIDYSDKSTVSGWGMPSSKYTDFTLGVSGSKYTAPANGYFLINKSIVQSTSGQYINLFVNDVLWDKINSTSAHQTLLSVVVKKGDVLKVDYTASGTTNLFRFYYAEGEV